MHKPYIIYLMTTQWSGKPRTPSTFYIVISRCSHVFILLSSKTASVYQCRVQEVPLWYAFIPISWMIISRRSSLSISSAASVVYIASSQQYTFLHTSDIIELSTNGSDSSSLSSSSSSLSFGSTVTVFLFRQLNPLRCLVQVILREMASKTRISPRHTLETKSSPALSGCSTM